MKYVRFKHQNVTGFGTLDSGGSIHVLEGDMFGASATTGEILSLDQVRLLPPSNTGTMIALWNNSTQQIQKLKRETPQEALWFLKPASSFATHGDPILYPRGQTNRVVLEGELGIVIGRTCRSVSADEAADCIFGYTIINDVTAQDLVGRDATFPQYTRAKGFDTFGLFGPVVETEIDPASIRIQAFLNGSECQNYPATDLAFSPWQIVAEISRTVTLQPGTVIACGTSLGVEPIQPGDTVEIRIEGIGALINTVHDA
jgi:2-keto-4-pentenoate hydratase/2-oxohepta-3-ene-1,7-dioic acid hydratase in catechol pathway